MAQFDVYPNPVASARGELPYVVVLQSDLLAALPSRLVAPLTRSLAGTAALPRRLAPTFEVAGEQLVLKPHEAGVLPRRVLRQPVGSLRPQAQLVLDALDAVTSGI